METTIVYWGNIGVVEKNMETTRIWANWKGGAASWSDGSLYRQYSKGQYPLCSSVVELLG